MPNFFGDILGPIIFGNNGRDKVRIINGLQNSYVLIAWRDKLLTDFVHKSYCTFADKRFVTGQLH